MNELASVPNPFRDNVVQDAWQSPTDVPEIHEDVFKACLEGVASAERGHPDSLLVHGQAGAGKTHLLTRLQRHLAETRQDAADRVLRCVFVYVRLQTTPELVWQHVRRRLATDLMRKDQGLSQLNRLVAHQIAERKRIPARRAVLWMRLGSEHATELSAIMADLAGELGLPRDLGIVLEHLVNGRHIRDASAWLAGDSLPERVLETLGLAGDAEADREASSREVALGLCKLAPRTLPVVFCFDQVEALQRARDDDAAFFAFGRAAADLCDADPNVFVLTCVQTALMPRFQSAIREADFERLAKRQRPLDELSPELIEKLIGARLKSCEPLAPSRESSCGGALWPFSAADVKALRDTHPRVARKVLAAAAERFDRSQGREHRVLDAPAFLTQKFDERLIEKTKALSEGETRSTMVQGAEVLAGIDRADVVKQGRDAPKEIDVVLEDRETKQRVAVSVREEADGRSLRPRLAALDKHTPRDDGATVVIIRHPRVPLPSGAPRAKEHLASLREKGAIILEPSVDALSALATFASMLADAKSGDLANEGDPVPESVVLAWMRSLIVRDPARIAPIDALAGELFAPAVHETKAVVERQETLRDIVTREKVSDVAEVSRSMDIGDADLLALARRSPDRWLVLEGPPALLLDMAGVVTEVEGGT